MATLTYRNHLIVASADFSGTARTWLPKVSVSWNIPGSHGIHFVSNITERFNDADDAVDFGVALGKSWVDDRLNSRWPTRAYKPPSRYRAITSYLHSAVSSSSSAFSLAPSDS